MSNVVAIPNREQIDDEASLWVAKLDRTLSDAEVEQLKLWVKQSPQHQDALFNMAGLWDKMDSLSRLSDLFETPPEAKPQRKTMMSLPSLSIAASIIACLVGVFFIAEHTDYIKHGDLPWQEKVSSSLVEAVYETGVGEYSTILLADGSELILNTNSLVRVEYSNHSRLLFLDRGEVHIEVAHDTSRPLSVVAKNKIVQAVGTAFNVQIYNDREVELIVTDGKVLVANKKPVKKGNLRPKIDVVPVKSLAVSKGEKVILGAADEKVDKIEEADISIDLSWQQGNLVFRGESLAFAVQEISRYTSVEFELVDDEIKDVRIAGLFKAGDINGLLVALDKNFQISHEKALDKKIRLMAK